MSITKEDFIPSGVMRRNVFNDSSDVPMENSLDNADLDYNPSDEGYNASDDGYKYEYSEEEDSEDEEDMVIDNKSSTIDFENDDYSYGDDKDDVDIPALVERNKSSIPTLVECSNDESEYDSNSDYEDMPVLTERDHSDDEESPKLDGSYSSKYVETDHGDYLKLYHELLFPFIRHHNPNFEVEYISNEQPGPSKTSQDKQKPPIIVHAYDMEKGRKGESHCLSWYHLHQSLESYSLTLLMAV